LLILIILYNIYYPSYQLYAVTNRDETAQKHHDVRTNLQKVHKKTKSYV